MSKALGALLGWHQWKLGWIDPAAIRCLATAGQLEETLTPVSAAGGVKLVVVPIDASRAYVVEAREPVGNDAALCDNGVLVSTVDATVWSGSPRPRQAGGAPTDGTLLGRCGALYNAPLDIGPGEVSVFHEGAVTVEGLLLVAAGLPRPRHAHLSAPRQAARRRRLRSG